MVPKYTRNIVNYQNQLYNLLYFIAKLFIQIKLGQSCTRQYNLQ
jgi:hypothetical protein